MATLLDELIVKIGLDGSAFNNEAAKTQIALTKTGAVARRESAALEENLKKTQAETGRRIQQVETVGRQASQQFTNMKNNVLGLLGVLAGAYGLQQFFRSIVGGDAALGNFAKTVGVSVEELGTWVEMGKRAGASAESVKEAFASINQIKQDIALRGQSAATPVLNAMGISPKDDLGNLRPTADILKDIGDFVSKHPPEQMRVLLAGIIPPDLIPLLGKGREELNKLEIAMRAAGVAAKRNADEEQEFLNKLADIEQRIRHIGRMILGEFHEPLMKALNEIQKWVDDNKGDIGKGVREAVPIVTEFGAAVEKVAIAVGGWGNVTKILLGLWVLSKLSPLLTFATSFLTLMVGATGATTALGVALTKLAVPAWFATFMRFLPALAALGFIGPADGEDEEFSRQKNEEWLRDHPGGRAGGASDSRLTSVRDRFANDPRLGISRNAAAGLVTNLNAESGIRGINEANNGPGFGWAQHTNTQGNPRRSNLEAFARAHGLDPASDEANYEFIVEELRTKYPNILAQLRRGDISASEAANIVARGYIVPPADKIPGHVADADRVSKLPTPPIPPPDFGKNLNLPAGLPLGPVSAIDPGYNLALRAPAAGADYSRTSSVETHVNGPIMVNTAATDADGIAKGIGAALQKYAYVPQVNAGLA